MATHAPLKHAIFSQNPYASLETLNTAQEPQIRRRRPKSSPIDRQDSGSVVVPEKEQRTLDKPLEEAAAADDDLLPSDNVCAPEDQEDETGLDSALMTALTTHTTPPPILRVMHGAFAMLIVTLGSLAVYTVGMPGNYVVWALFCINVPLWVLVTRLSATLGNDHLLDAMTAGTDDGYHQNPRSLSPEESLILERLSGMLEDEQDDEGELGD